MGRKCSTVYNGESCKSGYQGHKFKGHIFTFPSDNSDRQKWLNALPNYIDPSKVTKSMGICSLHWKPGYEYVIVKNGTKKPIKAPTEFGSTPKSYIPQGSSSYDRNSSNRGVLPSDRCKKSKEMEMQASQDEQRSNNKIVFWKAAIEYCNSLDLNTTCNDENIRLCQLSNDFPPKVLFSIEINRSFSVRAYHGSTPINLYDILLPSFQHKVTSLSQINAIVEKVKNADIDIHSEIKEKGNELLSLSNKSDDVIRHKLNFICAQLSAHALPGQHQGKSYDAYLISESVNLYLRSRNAYRALRSILVLPHEKTLRSFFGKFGSAGSAGECVQAVIDVFSTLNHQQKLTFISADEIYVKPAIRYRGGNVIGYAQNHDSPTPAKTVLALMVNFLRGSPAFVARIAPVANLKHDFLVDLLLVILSVIHESGGYVLGIVTDNFSVNQKAFKSLREKFTPRSIYSIDHPIKNDCFSILHLLYDVTHIMKNIRNNWTTEKTKTLEFIDPFTDEKLEAKWSDLVFIYKKEEGNMVRSNTLDYSSLYPNNFEKQKVSLVAKIFNEKTVACLEKWGKKDTARFVCLITRMWNMLNIKSPDAGRNLNDPDRDRFSSDSDTRFDFLLRIASSLKLMDSNKKGCRVKGLTNDTSNAVHQTIHGIVNSIKCLLHLGYEYVLPGKIQSDRLEGEFGIYRQASGGNYFISVEQVVNSLAMQRLQLYNKMNIQQSDDDQNINCCNDELQSNDEDLDLIETSFSEASNLNEEERSSLYYISGYVAFKENIGIRVVDKPVAESEFLQLVSRGKLSHPPEDLFDLSMYYYAFFKSRNKKCCNNIFLQAYELIYEYTNYEFENIQTINRRFCNSFFKAFVKMESDKITKEKNQKQLKKRKLNN